MNNKQTSKRVYKKITPQTVAKHLAQAAIIGNDSATVRATDPEYTAPGARGHRIVKKSKEMTTLEYIDNQLEQIGRDAIDRLEELVNSSDEKIAQKSVHYTIDHLRGQAVKRSFNVNAKANIQSVLD